MKFAVWILVAAAVMSLLALLMGELLPAGAAQSVLGRALGFADPFRSWWFRLLLCVLSLSLAVCVLERAPMLIKQAFMRNFLTKVGQLESFPGYTRIAVADGEQRGAAVLKRLGYSVQRQEIPGGVALSGIAGGLSRLGPLSTHLGLLFLILGGLWVSVTGESESVRGVPGQTLTRPGWGFNLRIDDFKIIYSPVKLNMWVEVDDGRRGKVEELKGDQARVSFGMNPGHDTSIWLPLSRVSSEFLILNDDGSMTPYQGNVQSYVSSVTVLEGDKEISKNEVYVNHPLRQNGYRFYQSSFQPMAAQSSIDSVVLHCTEGSNHAELVLKIGTGKAALPWGGYEAQVIEFFPDFRMDLDNHKPFSASNELNNPAAQVQLYKDGQPVGQSWAFGGSMGHMGGEGSTVSFTLADTRGMKQVGKGFATILEVNHDRGGWLVWLGFLLATLGLMLAYTTSQRSAWAVILRRGDGLDDLHLAGISSRDSEHFRQVWEDAISGIGRQ